MSHCHTQLTRKKTFDISNKNCTLKVSQVKRSKSKNIKLHAALLYVYVKLLPGYPWNKFRSIKYENPLKEKNFSFFFTKI